MSIDFDTYDLPWIETDWFIRPDGFDASLTIHGVTHTQRVWVHATEIAAQLGLEPWQQDAVSYAATWHDIGRTHDGPDYYHGAKSAGRAIGLGLHRGLEHKTREAALFAVTHHCGSDEHAERTAGYQPEPEATLDVWRALKDGDTLDRVRLGGVDPSYLKFDISHGRIEFAWALFRHTDD